MIFGGLERTNQPLVATALLLRILSTRDMDIRSYMTGAAVQTSLRLVLTRETTQGKKSKKIREKNGFPNRRNGEDSAYRN